MTESRGLWSHADFRKLWAGQTVSLFGSQVTVLALPLTAIAVLHATAWQMGLLEAAGSAASLVVGLSAGVWVDRHRRRPVMLAANLGRAALLFLIPVAAWLGVLQLGLLAAVSFLAAALAVFFNVARAAYLPTQVSRQQLIEANSRLALSASAAQVAGPGLGGALVQLLTPPVAIVADSLSFLVSALALGSISRTEHPPAPAREPSVRQEMREGLGAILAHPLLRSLTAASATFNLFDGVLFAVYILYMSRSLGLTAATIGLVFGLGGVGGVLGAMLVAPLTSRLGLGRAVLGGIALATAGELLIAAAAGPPPLAVVVLVVAEGAVELGATLYTVNVGSLKQAITPERLLGRVTASSDFVTTGTGPLGALLGGLLGTSIGLRGTVVVAGVGTLASLAWLARTPHHDWNIGEEEHR